MKVNTSWMLPVIPILIFIAFIAGCVFLKHKSNYEKSINDGERYSELPIIKTVEKDSYIFYILGDDVNQIEVNKDYYEKAIKNYKDSQDGK
ncbi:hypothetical protein ACN3ZE_001961 [Providencia rettgeri]|uniref:hypothetical protein n=1 Tax=Providencia sp. PROV197 TaxID=2949898 RepID=UPI002348F12D|nr:hypothetical protein [Providencia sp. PROV197]